MLYERALHAWYYKINKYDFFVCPKIIVLTAILELH